MTDFTKLPKEIAEALEEGGEPLTENQYIMLSGALAFYQGVHKENLDNHRNVIIDLLSALRSCRDASTNAILQYEDFLRYN